MLVCSIGPWQAKALSLRSFLFCWTILKLGLGLSIMPGWRAMAWMAGTWLQSSRLPRAPLEAAWGVVTSQRGGWDWESHWGRFATGGGSNPRSKVFGWLEAVASWLIDPRLEHRESADWRGSLGFGWALAPGSMWEVVNGVNQNVLVEAGTGLAITKEQVRPQLLKCWYLVEAVQ